MIRSNETFIGAGIGGLVGVHYAILRIIPPEYSEEERRKIKIKGIVAYGVLGLIVGGLIGKGIKETK